MTGLTKTIQLCDSCGAPATHLLQRHHGVPETRCETCARRDSNHHRGEAWAGVALLGHAALACREAGLTDVDIHAAARAALGRDQVDWAAYGPNSGLPAWANGSLEDDTHYRPLDETERAA